MSYNCLIIDDEPIAHDILNEYLIAVPELSVSKQCFNANDAIDYLKTNTVDILFLDIQMPGMDGIGFLQQLDNKPITIMTTANRDLALEGFELGVLDYLVKPIKKERFNMAVMRAIEFLGLLKNQQTVVEQEKEEDAVKRLTIKSGTKLISLETALITHIQGLKDYSIIYAGKEKYVIKGYLKNVEAFLPKNYFIRVHKSFIVAVDKIKVINRNRIELDSYNIPIGRVYKNIVEALL